MIGVEYDLFWRLNPKSLTPFSKAFSLKSKYEDSLAWTQGVYIQRAIASCLDKKSKYPDKPFLEKKVESKPMSTEELKKKMLERMSVLNKRFDKEE